MPAIYQRDLKQFTVLETRPYVKSLNQYIVEFEAEDGYKETQSYAAVERDRDTVLNAALDEFCASRVETLGITDSVSEPVAEEVAGE